MPRIFKYGDILNITFTPDKELNILIYRSPSYLIICRSHTLLKMVRFFLAHPVQSANSADNSQLSLKPTASVRDKSRQTLLHQAANV